MAYEYMYELGIGRMIEGPSVLRAYWERASRAILTAGWLEKMELVLQNAHQVLQNAAHQGGGNNTPGAL